MKKIVFYYTLLILCFILASCQERTGSKMVDSSENVIRYAKGFTIQNFEAYSIVQVRKPWPKAEKSYTYILKEKRGKIPDSLSKYTVINIPVKSIVVTSTTHIPSLEMLGEEAKLIGFPNLNYISSSKVRKRIEANKIKELGNNQSLNTEVLIDLQPDVIIGYGIDNNNPILDNLQKSGLKVMLNGDWNEETPLGKAEWIKFFGILFGKQALAEQLFSKIEDEYNHTIALAQKASKSPTVLAGDMFESKWYLPSGSSWGSQLLKQAKSNYLWAETTGTGSLSLSFEAVFERAKRADIWISSGQFSSLKEMSNTNPHYAQFDAFKTKNVYTFTRKKGKTGGVLYYELAPNRPDILLKDLVKILHPELLPNYEPYFFEQLQ